MKRFILSVLAFLGLFSSCLAQNNIKVLPPKEFIAAVKADTSAVILDVRQPSEYAEGHLDNAKNIDWLNQLDFRKAIAQLDKNRTYYVYCRSGRRSHAAADFMQKQGFKVFDMKGGILNWEVEKLPLVK